ncbi:hypothetical protein IWX46DRAFT_315026 [Phyllosticta citricarpa]|uniref:Secreted protein n=1 Tax=Phyllosticta citricarpa TaxID=55181 RepID=A0ABR1LKY0_9PEZI
MCGRLLFFCSPLFVSSSFFPRLMSFMIAFCDTRRFASWGRCFLFWVAPEESKSNLITGRRMIRPDLVPSLLSHRQGNVNVA